MSANTIQVVRLEVIVASNQPANQPSHEVICNIHFKRDNIARHTFGNVEKLIRSQFGYYDDKNFHAQGPLNEKNDPDKLLLAVSDGKYLWRDTTPDIITAIHFVEPGLTFFGPVALVMIDRHSEQPIDIDMEQEALLHGLAFFTEPKEKFIADMHTWYPTHAKAQSLAGLNLSISPVDEDLMKQQQYTAKNVLKKTKLAPSNNRSRSLH